MFKDYCHCRVWLEGFIPLVYGKSELGLERVENLLDKLGNPQRKFKSILVGGTSGKGSTAYYIARLLQSVSESVGQYASKSPLLPAKRGFEGQAACQQIGNVGKKDTDYTDTPTHRLYRHTDSPKIGLHVSPHLVDIRERMQIISSPCHPEFISGSKKILNRVQNDDWESELMPIKRFIGLANEIKPVVDAIIAKQVQLTPSYFEILVAMSFLYFAQEKVDWAVVEVGLGGRLDATNVLQPEITLITNVGLDHTEILGNTIEKIAWEKAGIIKTATTDDTDVKTEDTDKAGDKAWRSTGVPVVTGATGKALDVIKKVARLASAPVISVDFSHNNEAKRAKEKNAPLITLDTQGRLKTPKYDMFGYINRPYYSLRCTDGSFASQNKNLALATVLALGSLNSRHSELDSESNSGFRGIVPDLARTARILDKEAVKKAFSAGFPGRFEVLRLTPFAQDKMSSPLILDGAHNADKIKALIRAIGHWPLGIRFSYRKNQSKGKRLKAKGIVLVLAFKTGKDWKKMVDLLLKNLPVKAVVATQYQTVTDTGLGSAVDAEKIVDHIKSKWRVKVESQKNSQEAVMDALRQAQGKLSNDLVLVTGSLYLVGEVRTLWQLPSF